MTWPPQTFTWNGILKTNFRTPTAGELGMVEPLTDAEIADLRKLDAASVPPPWEARACSVVTSRDGFDIDGIPRPEEADLIAAARNALPRLLDELEDLREYRREMMERE